MTRTNYRNFFYNSYSAFKKLENEVPKTYSDNHDFRRYFSKLIPRDKNSRILEIGCGKGDLLLWLEGQGYFNIAGVDLNEEHVEFAKEQGLKSVSCCDAIQYLKNSNESYDCILAIDLIEHLTKNELIELFQIISEKLNPNGVIIVRTPNAESPFFGTYQHGDLTHETAYNRYSLNQISTAFKFKEVEFFECHQRSCPEFSLRPYYLKMYLKYQVYLFSWNFVKTFLLLDKNAICTKNIIACFRK